MIVSKDNLSDYLSEYTEEELFYKEVHYERKMNPENFSHYLQSLDPQYIVHHKLFVPELRNEPWLPMMYENDLFVHIPENIMLSKHNRYTPEFTHQHKFVEILCVYSGTVPTKIQGISHTLTTGDICIIPPNTQHSIAVFDDSIAFNIIIKTATFQSTFFQSLTSNSALSSFFQHVLYQKTEGNFLIFHTGNDERVRSTLEDLYIEYLQHEKYRSTFMNSILILLWAQLLRYHEHNIESVITRSTYGNSITEVLDYLSKNYQTVTLHDVAYHFGYSTSHFSTLIKESTGRTFTQIIKEIKLSQACKALSETQLSIRAICENVGYENPEHFMRLFKKAYNMTPGEYRKTHCE